MKCGIKNITQFIITMNHIIGRVSCNEKKAKAQNNGIQFCFRWTSKMSQICAETFFIVVNGRKGREFLCFFTELVFIGSLLCYLFFFPEILILISVTTHFNRNVSHAEFSFLLVETPTIYSITIVCRDWWWTWKLPPEMKQNTEISMRCNSSNFVANC